MNAILDTKQHELSALCRRYQVRRLDIFGSAAGDAFDAENSDLDFLVVFKPCSPSDHYEKYFGLLESLEALFGRPIDLVEADAMRNPYFIRGVNDTRVPIYAA